MTRRFLVRETYQASATNKKAIVTCFILGVLCLVLSLAAWGQVLYGTLTGNVTDPSGAVVPNAKVEVLNTQTGVTRSTATDANGIYRFSDLQQGNYKVSISSTGFATVALENVAVSVNNIKRADAQLTVAQAQTVVQVNAEQQVLQTDKADVHTDLTANEISNLPITSSVAGRNFQSLLRVVPGFGLLTEQNSAGGNPQRAMSTNVNGQSLQTINTRIDGAQDAYPWLPGNVAYVPPADAIETVNVVTNSFDAEQGMAGGAAVNVQIKSGTNQLHGTAHEFFTDHNLRTRNYFQTDHTIQANGQPRFPFNKPKNIKQQYGGTIGGPIVKDKLFYFGDYERTTQRQIAQATVTLPTMAMRNGDFTGLGVNIYDPATTNASGVRQQFSCNGQLNVICSNRIDPAAAKLIALMPALPAGATTTNNYVATGTAGYSRDNFDVKVNYVPGEKSTIFSRYSLSRSHIFDPPTLGALGGDATAGGQLGNSDSRIQSVGLGGTYTFSPTLLADWNFGFTRQRLGATALDIGSPFGLSTLNIPGTNGAGTTGDPSLYNGIPAFQTTSLANLGNPNTGNPFLFRDNQYVTGENVSWTKGKHAFRFGIEYNHTQLNHFQPQGSDGNFTTARGSFGFNGNPTTLNNSTTPQNPFNSFAQLLLGLPTRAGKAVYSNNPDALRWSQWAWYAGDQWQFNPKLTLTLGVRWEFYPFGYSDNGHGLPYFDPSSGNIFIGGNGNVPRNSNVDAGSGQFLPRVGIAYRLTPKTVVRAGYGMSADPNNWRYLRNAYPATITSDFGNASASLPITSLTGTNATGNYGAGGATVALPTGLSGATTPIPIPNTSSGVIPLPTGAGTRTVANPFRRGYVNSFNLTVQQEFAGFVGEAGYVGARGIRPLTNVNLNAAPICPAVLPNGATRNAANCRAQGYGELLSTSLGRNVADISAFVPFKNNYYDSLQTKLTRHFSGSSLLGVVYTWSKAINYSENEDLSGLFEHFPAYQSLDKALASFDRTHNLEIFAVYELPFGRGKKWAQSGVANWLAGGWQLNTVISRLSGIPFNVVGNNGNLNPNSARGLNQTVDLAGQYASLGNKPWSLAGTCPLATLSCHYFDPAVFAQPGLGVFGNVRRNSFRGPGVFGADLSVFRNFKLTERFTFQFRAEAFGLTNTPRFSNPNATCGSGAGTACSTAAQTNNFGAITSTLGTTGSNASTDGARTIWFAGKLIF